MAFASFRAQWFPPDQPPLTEKNLESQAGKVFLVTGASSGIGLELVRMLAGAGATVYLTARSTAQGEAAVRSLDSDRVRFVQLELGEYDSIRAAGATLAAQETRLDVLWNNAGVAIAPVGSVTAHGVEQHLGVNCVGPRLLTELLMPLLQKAPRPRIVWTSSWLAENSSPPGGVIWDELPMGSADPQRNYAVSKCGNWLLAVEAARRWGPHVLSVVVNPGNVKSSVWRHVPWYTMLGMNRVLYDTIYGAYSELYAGLSPDVTPDNNGAYIVPWGKIQESPVRVDVLQAMKSERDGGSDLARRFWEYCEELVSKEQLK